MSILRVRFGAISRLVGVLLTVLLVATSCGGSESATGSDEGEQAVAPAADVGEAVDEPAATATPVPEPTATPAPTATPEPTATPQPDLDGDGEPDATDPDVDGDGADDVDDDFPTDPARSRLLQPYFGSAETGLVLPDMSSTRALQGLREELASDTTTPEDIEQLFADSFVDAVGSAALVGFLDGRRVDGMGQDQVLDVRWVSEWDLRVTLGPADGSSARNVRLVSDPVDGRIRSLGINPGSLELASLVQPDQAELALAEAVASYADLEPEAAVLVAEIVDGECSVLADHESTKEIGIATVASGWLLGAVAEAINDGTISADDVLTVMPSTFGGVGSLSTAVFEEPTEVTVQQLGSLSVQVGDAGAIDVLHGLVGVDAIDELVEAHASDAGSLVPFLSASQVSHLHASVDGAQAETFLAADDDAQREFIAETLDPLGTFTTADTPAAGAPITPLQTWRSSAMDVCANLAALRSHPDHGASADFVNQAMSGATGLPGLVDEWDRVWQLKGGHPSPLYGQFTVHHVHSLAWLLENEGGPAYVVVTAANAQGGIERSPWFLDSFSPIARIHQLLIEDN